MNTASLEKSNRVVPNLEAFRLLSGKGFELIHLTLAIGESQTMHANPYRVVFYVLEGHGVLMLQNEKLQLFKDTCVEVEPEILRCWENAGQQPLKLLVVKFLE
jgi:mannose-6-phosphate isomerase-like protein (cupin superfamily)